MDIKKLIETLRSNGFKVFILFPNLRLLERSSKIMDKIKIPHGDNFDSKYRVQNLEITTFSYKMRDQNFSENWKPDLVIVSKKYSRFVKNCGFPILEV